jgi:tRNA 2-thiouridine synthesizing protein A
MADHFLDLKGLKCPLPVMKANKALRNVATGKTLEVIATDPGAVADFEVYCRKTGNKLLEASRIGDTFRFLIKRT